ncbi:unnamed protein product [Lactuca virosa]|uniref:Pentatricopeptide repeat-containing protein n=1 Tax=Lactuca virosa TaxID=75947 RepID=A0AAU9NRD1_9ASTR|nr:unnamed protein product [Lactuca virosa]
MQLGKRCRRRSAQFAGVFLVKSTEHAASGDLESARKMFDQMGTKRNVTCNHGEIRLIENMDLEANSVIWATMIRHGNDELFEYISRKVFDKEVVNYGYWTLIANLSSSFGRWEDALRFRLEMREKGIEKIPSFSLIKIGDSVPEFVGRDPNHVYKSDIYEILSVFK